MVNSSDKQQKGKKGSSVMQTKYLPIAHRIALLDDNGLRIVDNNLVDKQEIAIKNKKEKVICFCLNAAVYHRDGGKVLQTD